MARTRVASEKRPTDMSAPLEIPRVLVRMLAQSGVPGGTPIHRREARSESD